MGMKKKKYVYLEALRVAAILLVVFNHTGTNGYLYFTTAGGHAGPWAFYASASVLCKVAVPLFLMVSGAVLLGKDEPISAIWKKRVPRILALALVWSAVQYVLICAGFYEGRSIDEPSIVNFFTMFYHAPMISPYWYLYIYLAFLAILPFLRMIAARATWRHYVYLFLMQVAFQTVTSVLALTDDLTASPDWTLPFLANIVLYPLLGYGLHTRLVAGRVTGRQLLAGVAASAAAVAVSCWFVVMDQQRSGNLRSEAYVNVLVVVPTVTLFAAFGLLFHRFGLSPRLRAVLMTLGSCTFGVYLLEEILRQFLVGPVVRELSPVVHTFSATLVAVFLVFVVGTALTWPAKQLVQACHRALWPAGEHESPALVSSQAR